MADLPTPVDVPAGHVVRVRLGGSCYTSAVLAPAVARTTAHDLVRGIEKLSTGTGFLDFTTADGTTAHLKARSVSAVEYGPPHARKDHRRPEVINVFLDGGSLNAADVVELVDETAVPR